MPPLPQLHQSIPELVQTLELVPILELALTLVQVLTPGLLATSRNSLVPVSTKKNQIHSVFPVIDVVS